MSSGKVESVKQRLKNVTKKQDKQFNDVLQMYFLERFCIDFLNQNIIKILY